MNYLRPLLTGLASGTVLGTLTVAVRRRMRQASTGPEEVGGALEEEREPILGYDGMDADSLIDWLEDAELDRATLRRVRDYERRHAGREDVLAAIEDLLD